MLMAFPKITSAFSTTSKLISFPLLYMLFKLFSPHLSSYLPQHLQRMTWSHDKYLMKLHPGVVRLENPLFVLLDIGSNCRLFTDWLLTSLDSYSIYLWMMHLVSIDFCSVAGPELFPIWEKLSLEYRRKSNNLMIAHFYFILYILVIFN